MLKPRTKTLFLIFLSCALINFQSNLLAFHFIADADIHCDGTGITTPNKGGHLELMQELKDNPNIDLRFVLFPGDLTDHGKVGNCSLLCMPQLDEWGEFLNMWYTPLHQKNISVYLCPGNHDDSRNWVTGSVYNKIKEMNRGQDYYSFDIGKNEEKVHFICCGIYPNNKTLTWLTQDLSHTSPLTPTFIFFHYNLTGQWSDFWSKAEKEQFYQVIQNQNVKAIITGHIHTSYSTIWKGIPVIGVGGKHFALINFDPPTKNIEVTFHAPGENKEFDEVRVDWEELDKE